MTIPRGVNIVDTFNTKPFNLTAAKAGAPVITTMGRSARIISFDKKSENNLYPILALVSENEGGVEYTVEYSSGGINNAVFSTLVMKALFQLDGKNVFYGDILEYCNSASISDSRGYGETWEKITITTDVKDSIKLRWPNPPKPLPLLAGRSVTKDSLLWAKIWTDWNLVRAGDTIKHGLASEGKTHLDRLDISVFQQYYRWDKPVFLQETEVTENSILWYNSNPTRFPRNWKQIKATDQRASYTTQTFLEYLRSSYDKTGINTFYKWEKPVIVKTLQKFQAIRRNDGQAEYLDTPTFNSIEEGMKYIEASTGKHPVVRFIPTIQVEVAE